MRLSDYLTGLGRPIIYYPELTHVTGALTAGVFICDLIQWTGKQKDPGGWIYKTQADIQSETGLTRREQETARKILRDKGFLEEVKRGIPARIYYRVNVDAVNDAVDDHLARKDGGKRQSVEAESAITERTEPPHSNGGNPPSISEVTPEDSSESISEREGGGVALVEDAAMTGATAPPTLSENRIRVKALSDEYRDKYGKRKKGGI